MVKFMLPVNSKVVEGRTHNNKEQNISPKKLKIYRWDPEKQKNPRLDSYETVSYTHLTLPTKRIV